MMTCTGIGIPCRGHTNYTRKYVMNTYKGHTIYITTKPLVFHMLK